MKQLQWLLLLLLLLFIFHQTNNLSTKPASK